MMKKIRIILNLSLVENIKTRIYLLIKFICIFVLSANFYDFSYAQINRNINLNFSEKTFIFDSQAQSKNLNIIALENISRIVGIETDQDLVAIINKFNLSPDPGKIDPFLAKKLIEEESIYKWGGLFQEFIVLANFLFEDFSSAKKQEYKKQFESSKKQIEDFIESIHDYVKIIHPGFKLINMTNLQKNMRGRGIRIAVFDVFENDLLAKQTLLYPNAKIRSPMNFGDPVHMNHGNIVIDVILQIAPEAEIIPVSSDAKSYTAATQFMALSEEIDVVNMSRAFAQLEQTKKLDPDFSKALKVLIQNKIFCKSLGNTGTDLDGVLNPRRVRLGLGPVNNLFAYDLDLIKDLFTEPVQNDLLIFAENLTPFADDMALTATIPGNVNEVKKRTLSVPAEGVWSASVKTFESGSSFAAPQLAALSALLFEAIQSQSPQLTKLEQEQRVILSLKQSAHLFTQKSEDWGIGLVDADAAFMAL